MITFKAEDGYSYLISKMEDGVPNKVFRIDSGEVSFQLGTYENLKIERMDVKPEVSMKIKNLLDTFKV